VIQKMPRRAWLGLWLLMLLLPAVPCAAAAPNLLGLWQGSSPGIFSTYCITRAVKLNIVHQCGNLFRGDVTISGTAIKVVGSVKEGMIINVHGMTSLGSSVIILGNYQAGSQPQINVIFFYPDTSSWEGFDDFRLSYAGPPIIKGGSGAAGLLLLDK
jgi:hypothetical protein